MWLSLFFAILFFDYVKQASRLDVQLSRVISGLGRAGKCVHAEENTFGLVQASASSFSSQSFRIAIVLFIFILYLYLLSQDSLLL